MSRKAIKLIFGATVVTAVCTSLAGKLKRSKETIPDTVNPLYENDHKPYGIYEKYLKRPADCILASGALVVFSPVMALIALLIRTEIGSPVLFAQDRPGKDGRIFKLYKFRTMTDERDENGNLLSDEKRLTKLGMTLRELSLDELPELLNIAEGDMAIIGPRPLLVRYLPYYTLEEMHRHDVRPGLSGLAQINGRNYVPWDQRLAYDLKYVERITLKEDIRILLETAAKTVRRSDVAINTDEVENYLDEERRENGI